jgi:hypothetical protein
MKSHILTCILPFFFFSSVSAQGIGCPANVLHGSASIIGNLDAKRDDGISATRTKATLSRTKEAFVYRKDLRLELTGLGPGDICMEVTKTGDVFFEPCDCRKYSQVFYFQRPLGNYGPNEYLLFNPYTGYFLWNDGARVKYQKYEYLSQDEVEDHHVWVVGSDNFFAGVF